MIFFCWKNGEPVCLKATKLTIGCLTIPPFLLLTDFTPEDLERLPLGYQIPIKEILHHHKNMDQTNMNMQTAIFLGEWILKYLDS